MTIQTNSKTLFPLILGGLLILAVVGFYWPVLVNLVAVMIRNEDSSYGLILPLISGYIIYRKWPDIRQQPLQPSWLGIAVIAAGFGLYIFGELFQSLYIPSVSLIIVLAGLLILAGGWNLARLLAFPLFLLIFMIPYEGFLVRKVTLPLQLISSKLAAGMLSTLGYTVYRHGNIIDLGTRQLNIVAACSGLRYVINLMALGAIFCYFFQRRPWKVAIILASLVPFAIFANAVRIASIGIFPILQEGWWHTSIGLSIFLLGFDFLKLINWTVNRQQTVIFKPSICKKAAYRMQDRESVSGFPWISLNRKLVTAFVFVMICGPLTLFLSNPSKVPLLQSFDNFPLKIGGWRGNRNYIDNKILQVLQADSYLDIEFTDTEGNKISLWIAYYENLPVGEGKFTHSPQLCLRGSGWDVIESGTIYVSSHYPVVYMLVQQGNSRQLVYYWYIQSGRWVVHEQYLKKIYAVFDGLVKRRSDAALIRIMTPINRDNNYSKESLESFMRLIIPIVKQFLPI
ncbi:MAG: exosortase C-terminal domain/associated protein EpsI [Thermodesulfobacteriota bacterium]